MSWLAPWVEEIFGLIEPSAAEAGTLPDFQRGKALVGDLLDGYSATGGGYAGWVEGDGQINLWLHDADVHALANSVSAVTNSLVFADSAISASWQPVPGASGLGIYLPPYFPVGSFLWPLSNRGSTSVQSRMMDVEFRPPPEFQGRRTSDWSLVTLFSEEGGSARVMDATLGRLGEREPKYTDLRRDLGLASPFFVAHRPIGPLVAYALYAIAPGSLSAEREERLLADTRSFELFAGVAAGLGATVGEDAVTKQARAVAGARVDLDLARDFAAWLWTTSSEWLEEER